MKKYSVLLLYPDYLADTYGEDTYYGWVEAFSVAHAISKAQIDCYLAQLDPDDLTQEDSYFPLYDPVDMAPLLVTSGYNWGHRLPE